MSQSEARIRAVREYENKNYDRLAVRLPKGTREQIKATGYSFNKFILEAVLEKIDRITIAKEK